MPSQGPLSPGTLADDAGVGSTGWLNPENAGASDDSRAQCPLAVSAVGHYLKATNFSFSIPGGATIDGIIVEVEKKQTTGLGLTDNRARIVKGGVIGTTDRSDVSAWPSTEAYTTYGSSSDLWGESWSSSDINGSGFGFAISPVNGLTTPRTAEVDHIRITVVYTDAAAPGTPHSVTVVAGPNHPGFYLN